MIKEKISVRNALNTLLRVCDGAEAEDGQGFNKFDSRFARDLSSKSEWTYAQEKAAHKMLKKYRKQLSDNHGIDYSEIEFENDKSSNKNKNNNSEVKKVDYLKDGKVFVKFDYKKEYVEEVKKISGRKWDGDNKRWIVPINSETIPQLREFVKEFRFKVTDEATVQINKRKNIIDKKIELLDNGKVSIEFPFDYRLVSEVKRITGRKWDGDNKRWIVPLNLSNCDDIIDFGNKNGFEIDNDIFIECAKKEEDIKLSQSDDADINVEGFGDEDLKLRPFQRAGVKYASEKKRTFIADMMGLGKTIESLATVHNLNAYPLLIVCPATLKLNWQREINKWLGDKSVRIIDGRDNDDFDDYDIYIINYDIVHHNKEELKRLNLNSMIADESHYVKNHKAKRTKAVQEIVNDSDIEVRLLLTGTPIKNRPKELISQLTILDRLNDIGGFWHFANRYCDAKKTRWGTDMSGAKNLEELNDRLREVGYVRRRKEDVLSELPDKVRTDIYVDIDNRDSYNEAERNIISWIEEHKGEDDAINASRAEVLVQLNTLKRLASEGKKKEVIEWVRDFLESDEKLVLFAHHINLVKSLRDEFDALAIFGETSLEEKQNAVDKFQNDPDEKLIVISLQAGSEGITLTSASNVAFAELGWTPAEHDQAEDRCHRIGQKDSVNAWYLIARNTIDEDVKRLIEEKREIFNKSVDGGELGGGDDIVDSIVNNLV